MCPGTRQDLLDLSGQTVRAFAILQKHGTTNGYDGFVHASVSRSDPDEDRYAGGDVTSVQHEFQNVHAWTLM